MPLIGLGAASCIFGASAVRAASVDDSQRVYFTAEATIDASGKADIGNIERLTGALAEALRVQLEARTYEPARMQGQPVASTTHISAFAVLTALNEKQMQISVESIGMGPRSRHVAPPSYPFEMARKGLGGSALAVFTVNANGTPGNVRLLDVSDPRIDKSLKEAIRDWRFVPETIAGAPSNEDMAVPVWFRAPNDTAKPPAFRCPLIGGRPHVDPGATGCMDMIEVSYHVRQGQNIR